AGVSAALALLQVTVPAGFDGEIKGSVSVTFTDAPSDTETNPNDNSYTSSTGFSITVDPIVSVPMIVSDLTGAPLVIKEDGSATVTLTATAGATDVITKVAITGLDPKATYVINGVQV